MGWGMGKARLWWGEEQASCEGMEEVHLWVNGPLLLTGAGRGATLRVAGLGKRRVKTVGKVVEVRMWGPVQVKAPAGCLVRAQRVNGPLTVKHLEGALHLETVNGPVTGQDVAAVQVGQVRGPLMLRRVKGAVLGEGPRGPLTLEDVQGEVRLDSPVRGALDLRRVAGDVALTARGNARWVGPLSPGQTVRLKVDGDLRLVLPEESDVRIVARVQGDLHAPFDTVGATQGRWETTLGQGTATLDLEVGGDLWLAWAGEAEETAEEEADLPDWSAAWSEEEAVSSRRPTAAEEERLLVLRMLANKRITAEEAERLLAALEGEG